MSELQHYIKDVSPVLGEYFTEFHLVSGSGDYVDMEFNQDFIIQDIIVTTQENISSGDEFQISLKYPQSQRFGLISTITASSTPSRPLEFFLNSTNDDANTISTGHLGTGKQWYRVAARTRLRVEVTALVTEGMNLRFNVIGHRASYSSGEPFVDSFLSY